MKYVINYLQRLGYKFGYDNNLLTIKDSNYIFKTNNVSGIESRYIEIFHNKSQA